MIIIIIRDINARVINPTNNDYNKSFRILIMKKFSKISVFCFFTLILISNTDLAMAADNYRNFPVTVKGWMGTQNNSVAYTGQIARHTLHDSLKKLAGKGNGKPNSKLKAEMMSYYAKKDAGRAIIAPKGKAHFPTKQTGVDQISKGGNLSGKTYKGAISGMPNQMTGPDLIKFWIDKASKANKG